MFIPDQQPLSCPVGDDSAGPAENAPPSSSPGKGAADTADNPDRRT